MILSTFDWSNIIQIIHLGHFCFLFCFRRKFCPKSMREGAGKKQTSNKKNIWIWADPVYKIYRLLISYVFRPEICLYISVKCTLNVCIHLNARKIAVPQKTPKYKKKFTFKKCLFFSNAKAKSNEGKILKQNKKQKWPKTSNLS